MKAPQSKTSITMARNAKMVMPPRQQVRMTAKIVYTTPTPDMPSTALSQFGMAWLWLDNADRKYEKIPRIMAEQKKQSTAVAS